MLAVLLLGAPVPAHGQNEDGVFVDPDTPAGKEYAVPSEEARREAGGSGDSKGDSPLFGVGVGKDGDGKGSGDENGSDDPSDGTGDDADDLDESESSAATGSGSDGDAGGGGGGSGATLPLMIGLAVLSVGALGGFLFRRLSAS